MENLHKPYGPYERFFKRPLDFTIALVALIILSPVLIVLTIIGAIAMKGNPFFVQQRPGRIDKNTGEERIFYLIKFRTMTNEKDDECNLLPDLQRINAYGRFLREYSLDELPQIINVLFGSCSFIGPRPLLVSYIDLYSRKQRHRHDVRPGLTGYAQVNGRNALEWEERFEMDVWYTKNVCLKTDVKIILDTVRVVLNHENVDSPSSTATTMEKFKGTKEVEDENAVFFNYREKA